MEDLVSKMIETNNQDASIYCDKCNHEFKTSEVKLLEKEFRHHDKDYKLLFFVCEKCGELFKVKVSNEYLEELIKEMIKFRDNFLKKHVTNKSKREMLANSIGYEKKRKKVRQFSVLLESIFANEFGSFEWDGNELVYKLNLK